MRATPSPTQNLRRRSTPTPQDLRSGPRMPPPNTLTAVERATNLGTVNAAPYRELLSHQTVPRLADEGR